MRLDAIKSLNSLMTPNHIAGLRLFSDRFKGRILEMSASEPDTTTRLLAIEAVVKLGELDLLDEEDASFIVPLLFDSDVKVRQAGAPLIPGLLKEKQLTESDDAPAQLKLLCQLVLENMTAIVKLEEKVSKNSSSQWDDMSFEEEEVFRARIRDRNDLADWFKTTSKKPLTLPFGPLGAKCAVDALWNELPLVKVFSCQGIVCDLFSLNGIVQGLGGDGRPSL